MTLLKNCSVQVIYLSSPPLLPHFNCSVLVHNELYGATIVLHLIILLNEKSDQRARVFTSG